MGALRSCTVADLFSLDAAALTTEREFTPEKFLVVPGTIARVGVQPYYARELGLDDEGIPANKVIKLYRPVEEVSAPASLASGENKPLTVGHPKDGVTADNWRDLAVGEARDLRFVPDNAPAGGHIKARLIVKDSAAIKAIQNGKNQISCGYTFDLDRAVGTSPTGEPYDGIMRNIRFNHHAIVDFARGGSGLRVADEQQKEPSMVTRKLVVDGIPLELEDQAAGVIEKLLSDRKAALDMASTAEQRATVADEALRAEKAATSKLVSDHATALKAAQDKIPTAQQIEAMAAERAKVVGDALKMCPELATDGKSVDEVRRTVVADVSAKNASAKVVADAIVGPDITKASAELVTAAFNALAVSAKAKDTARTAGDEAISAALLGDGKDKQLTGPKQSARDAWIAKQQAK